MTKAKQPESGGATLYEVLTGRGNDVGFDRAAVDRFRAAIVMDHEVNGVAYDPRLWLQRPTTYGDQIRSYKSVLENDYWRRSVLTGYVVDRPAGRTLPAGTEVRVDIVHEPLEPAELLAAYTAFVHHNLDATAAHASHRTGAPVGLLAQLSADPQIRIALSHERVAALKHARETLVSAFLRTGEIIAFATPIEGPGTRPLRPVPLEAKHWRSGHAQLREGDVSHVYRAGEECAAYENVVFYRGRAIDFVKHEIRPNKTETVCWDEFWPIATNDKHFGLTGKKPQKKDIAHDMLKQNADLTIDTVNKYITVDWQCFSKIINMIASDPLVTNREPLEDGISTDAVTALFECLKLSLGRQEGKTGYRPFDRRYCRDRLLYVAEAIARKRKNEK